MPAMNSASLRFAALAVAVLPMTASAQTDAAFAAALGKLPSGLATIAELKTQSQQPATDEETGFQVDRELLAKLKQATILLGEVIPPATGRPYTGWTFTQLDPRAEFQAMSVTFFGPEPDDIREIKFLASRRASTATGSRAENYLYTTDSRGLLLRVTRLTKVIGPDGIEVKGPYEQLDPLDPANQALFVRILAQWKP